MLKAAVSSEQNIVFDSLNDVLHDESYDGCPGFENRPGFGSHSDSVLRYDACSLQFVSGSRLLSFRDSPLL